MISIFLFLSIDCVLAQKIVLPPDPGWKNNRTLMGIDSNNNNVRDDLEIFVYKEITKDEKLFKAYLNYIESKLMMMKYADNNELLRKYHIQEQDDMTCIFSIKDMMPEEAFSIVKKIYNTPLRDKTRGKIEKKWNSIAVSINLVDKNKRYLKCR